MNLVLPMAAGLKEPKYKDFSNFYCVIFANISLSKANHNIKFRIKVENILLQSKGAWAQERELLAILLSIYHRTYQTVPGKNYLGR